VPLPKVRGISEQEAFTVVNTGKKTHQKSWKRMIVCCMILYDTSATDNVPPDQGYFRWRQLHEKV